MKTRVFKSGNSRAVRLPAEIAFDLDTELEIARVGDVITLVPATQNTAQLVAELRRLPKPGEVEKREPIDMPDRGD